MTRRDLIIALFGPPCGLPNEERYGVNGEISYNTKTDEITIGVTAPIKLPVLIGELTQRSNQNGGDGRATIEEYVRERKASQDEQAPELPATNDTPRGAINIPPALKPLTEHKRWVTWRWEQKENGEWTKVPYQGHAPSRKASTKNPNQWCYFKSAMSAYTEGRCDGVGYVLTDGDISAIDIDDCRNATTGELHPWATEQITRSNSYVEVTPSNEGVRIVGLSSDGTTTLNNRYAVPGTNVKGELFRHPPGRYITITGKQIGDAIELKNIDAEINDLASLLITKSGNRSAENFPVPFKLAAGFGDLKGEDLGEGLPKASPELSDQWRKLNSEAIRRYSDWVPDIFPTAAPTSDGGYRVTSASLGRDLQEDLSFHEQGIKDFGVHDMGDPRRGKRTPIDIVKQYLHNDFNEAVCWLAEKLDLVPNDYLPKPETKGSGDPEVDAEITRLAKLSIIEYEHEREAVAEKLSIRVTTLEKLVAKKRTPSPQLGAGGLQDDLALKFSATYATNLRYVAAWNKWFHWDGVRWVEEKTLYAFHLARDICRKADQEAADHAMVVGVIGLARTDRRQAATTEQWDADPWLLGTPEGTIDLRTSKLAPPKAADYITKITAVAPSNEPPRDSCPLWLTFLNRVTNSNEKLQDYLQRACGYCLTGVTVEDALFFHYGNGGNGKSVFLETISGILRDYHEAADMEMFVVSYSERHPTDLASLRGARLVTAVESEQGKRWAEAKLKQMTGGDPIKARFMRQDFFTYIPQFKLMFAGNHKPAIRNVDEAISRRFHLAPWLVTIPENEKDKDLSDKLKPEWPGILRWMLDGCLEWQRIGLTPPKIVTDATKEYLDSQDIIQDFFDDCCVRAKEEFDTFTHIWDGYVDWCENSREFVGTKKAFGQKLKDKGFQSITQGQENTLTYLGIRCTRENARKLKEEELRKKEQERKNSLPNQDWTPE
jgi:putative DNA primase/helicase